MGSGRRKVRVAVLYGGRSAEHEVSVVSARCVMEAMDPGRYEVVPVAITKGGRWLLPNRSPSELATPKGSLPSVGEDGLRVVLERQGDGAGLVPVSGDVSRPGIGAVDVVLPLLHGPYGEDGTVQGLLELAGVPYVGAGVLASALGMDKDAQKRLFAARGMPVVPWIPLLEVGWKRDPGSCEVLAAGEIGFPCFVKPARLGSSIGISKCRTAEELRSGIEEAFVHDDKVVIEKGVAGRELECGVLGNDQPEASVVGEIKPCHDFYDFSAKYLEEGSQIAIPAPVPAAVAEEVRRLAVEAFRALECSGMARVDFFYEEAGAGLFVNEVNTIPGFTPISMYPKLWDASGIPYARLIDRLIELAMERHDRRRGR